MAALERSELNALARKLKSLHVPGHPVILTNVHDAYAAQLIASDPSCKAIATASWSIAATQGIDDDDMTLEQNLQGIRNVVKGIANAGKTGSIPLSCDLQDGYEDVGDSVRQVIALGCVGVNIEDVDCHRRQLRSVEDAVDRVKQVVRAAEDAGVPDFVVNARVDVLGYGGSMDNVQERCAAYLAAGATSAFVWGVRVKELEFEDVKGLCEKFDGRIAVHGPGPAKLSVDELRKAGVNRISVGPWVYKKSMEVFVAQAKSLLSS